MSEPSIEEILRVWFGPLMEERFKGWPIPPFELKWPDDKEGQAQCIRTLADLAANPLLPHEAQTWAFDKLTEIARKYREEAKPGSVPIEMAWWCFEVVSGGIKRPKRGRGRDRWANLWRDEMIIRAVQFLRDRGETKEAAIRMVAKAVEQAKKAKNPRLSFGPDGVESVLDKAIKSGSPIQSIKKEMR